MIFRCTGMVVLTPSIAEGLQCFDHPLTRGIPAGPQTISLAMRES